MSPHFYSLGMLVNGRAYDEDRETVSAVDLLAEVIADEERGPHPWINFLFKEPKNDCDN